MKNKKSKESNNKFEIRSEIEFNNTFENADNSFGFYLAHFPYDNHREASGDDTSFSNNSISKVRVRVSEVHSK